MTGVTARGVVRAEWTKLLSLRSTWAVLGATAVLTVGFAGLVGWNQAAPGTRRRWPARSCPSTCSRSRPAPSKCC